MTGIVKRVHALADGRELIYFDDADWHQAPVGSHRESARLHLQLTSPRRGADKLKYLAGSESAMGAWVGDVSPEAQAGQLRAAIARADAEDPA